MVAGESSGDLLGGLLLQSMRSRWPELQTFGIGGPAMQAQGFQSWWPSERLALRGYLEVLPRFAELVHMRKLLGDRLLADRPELFIGIDAPDFNLDLERRLRSAGLKTVQFVSPAFWAWRAEKLPKLRQAVDLVLCIFPFEPALLESNDIAARYVGHPLASLIPLRPDQGAARRALGLESAAEYVALLPGSRVTEVSHLAPRFLAAAALLTDLRPGLRFLLPAVATQYENLCRSVAESAMASKVTVLRGQSHAALAACDVALVASGTATLEAALFKRPMVIAYHMNWLSWQVTQHKRRQPWVGLPNILCQELVVPELLQRQATPQAMARAVLDWFDDPSRIESLQRRFEQLHHDLKRDTSRLALDAIEELCARPGS